MVTHKKLSGRAEYEDVIGRMLFEDQRAIDVFPWLNEEGFGVGWLYANRGEGKTFFVKKFAEESDRNVQIRHLDKQTLEYITPTAYDDPDVIVLDDIHYLVDVMRIGQLGEEIISEREVLDQIVSAYSDADELGAKLLFVADQIPTSIADYFNDEDAQSDFLDIIQYCLVGGFDVRFMENKGRDYVPENKESTLRYREFITGKAIQTLRSELNILDIPILGRSKRELDHKTTVAVLPAGFGKRLDNAIEVTGTPREPGTHVAQIPVKFQDPFTRLKKEMTRNFPVEYRDSKRRFSAWSNRIVEQSLDPSDSSWPLVEFSSLILPIRELSILSANLGEISRKSLSIRYGHSTEKVYRPVKVEVTKTNREAIPITSWDNKRTVDVEMDVPIEVQIVNDEAYPEGGAIYNFKQLKQIESKMARRVMDLADSEMMNYRDLAAAMLTVDTGRDLEELFLEHRLLQE